MRTNTLKQLQFSLCIALPSMVALFLLPDGQFRELALIISTIALAVAIHAAWRIRGIARQIQFMVGECGKGNLEPRLWVSGERGSLFDTIDGINHMVDIIDAFIREAKAAMQSAMDEKYYRKIQLTGLAGTYRQGAQIFNDGLDKIRENTLRSIRKAVTELDGSAQQSETQAKQLLSSVSITSDSISSVAAAMEEMSATISEIALQIDQASRISGNTSEKAKESGVKLNELTDSIRQISTMATAIQDITDKTNLLALNATIEAARAGESGKGFSVVASEVKLLAKNTAQATEQISHNVEKVHQQMELVVQVISEMIALINRMDEASLIISSAMTEQSTAAKEIARAVGSASSSSQEVTHTAQQVAQQAQRTWEVSRTMRAMCN